MKKTVMYRLYHLIAILSIGLSSSSLIGQEVSFQGASQALEDGEIQTAQLQYKQLIEDGFSSPELYSNLAKTYYLDGDRINAILYYERALRLAPSNDDVINALNNIRQELDVRLSDIPDFIVVAAYRGYVRSLSPRSWLILQVLFGGLSLVGLYLLFFKAGGVPKWTTYGVGIAALLFLLSWLWSHQAKSYIMSRDEAIITVNSTSLYSAPDDISPEVTAVVGGIKIWITDELGDWYKVRLRDKDEGWVKKEEVTII